MVELVEVPAPTPASHEVARRLTAAAINRLDLQIREGTAGLPIPLPCVGGMELVDVVIDVGSEVEGWTAGDRGIRDVTDSCGVCRCCRAGREWRCVRGALTLNSVTGGFAEVPVCDGRRLAKWSGSESSRAYRAVRGQAAREVGRPSVLARSLWRSSRVDFHWNGAAICS